MNRQIGLRIDVDTWRGTERGVPELCRILAARGIKGTFFFSAGPDNMGRHLWRLLKPQFLWKMLRSNAPSLYGWDIILRGTLWPGPIIGAGQQSAIRGAAEGGHEIGMHAWDHHAWQMRVEKAGRGGVRDWMQRAIQLINTAAGQTPICAATPGWRCTDEVLLCREEFTLQFNSDCRGTSIFRPRVDGKSLSQLQIPSTLPTYDELIGQNGITNETYNAHLISLLRPDELNVLTIHAEAEGIVCARLFEQFLDEVLASGWQVLPLGEIVKQAPQSVPECAVIKQVIAGREGWVAVQGEPEAKCQ